jgi:hypothetical protein
MAIKGLNSFCGYSASNKGCVCMTASGIIDSLGLSCFKGLRSEPKVNTSANNARPVIKYEVDKFGIMTEKKPKKSAFAWLKSGKGQKQRKAPVQIPEIRQEQLVETAPFPVRTNFRRSTTPSMAHSVSVGSNPTRSSSTPRFPTPSANEDAQLEWALKESKKEQERVAERKAMSLSNKDLAAYEKKLGSTDAIALAEAQRKEDFYARRNQQRKQSVQPTPERVTVQNIQHTTTAQQKGFEEALSENIDLDAQIKEYERLSSEHAAKKSQYIPAKEDGYDMPAFVPTEENTAEIVSPITPQTTASSLGRNPFVRKDEQVTQPVSVNNTGSTNPFDSAWRSTSNVTANTFTQHQIDEIFGKSHPITVEQAPLIQI